MIVLRRVLGRRGVSEVFGALLLAMVMLAVTVTYVTFELQRTSREVHGIVDLIRTAEKRQSVLLSLTYYTWVNRSALYFDGSGSDYVAVSDSDTLDFTSAVTIDILFKLSAYPPPTAGRDWYCLLVKDQWGSTYGLMYSRTGLFRFYLNPMPSLDASFTPELNVWYHIIATWNGSVAKIFINGQLYARADRSGTLNVNEKPIYIGRCGNGDYPLNGTVGLVKLYGRGLTDEEALLHYKGYVGSDGLALYLPLDGDLKDKSGNGNHGTNNGAEWTEDAQDDLKLYLYNYGDVVATPKLFAVDGEVVYWRTVWTFKWHEVTDSSGTFGDKLGESMFRNEEFTFNWWDGVVYDGRSDHVGYVAEAEMYFTGSSTTVTIRTDDGMEVYIDGQPIFNGEAWKTQSPTTYVETVTLTPGTHTVTVKWYDWEGAAYTSFSASNVSRESALLMVNMDTEEACSTIPEKTLVELTLPAPSTSTFNLVLLTVEGAVYSWEISL